MRALWICCGVVFTTFAFATAEAGNVITTNLPSGEAIVAIDSQTDGSNPTDGSQNDWNNPFTTGAKPLEYTFSPGTYTFRIINSTDAATMFPSLSSSQLAEIGNGAWTYNNPWITQYMAWDAKDPSGSQLFTGAVESQAFGNAAAAYQAAISGGYYDTIVTGSGRNTGTVESSFTFTSTTTLIFAIPDNGVSDNSGTIGVLITGQAVPEPSTALLLGAAMAGLGAVRLGRMVYRGKR
jgi:hypothetical protein